MAPDRSANLDPTDPDPPRKRATSTGLIKADEELKRQLTRTSGLIKAVFTLQPSDPQQTTILPGDALRMTDDLLQHASELTGLKASDFHVFRNLGSFVVAAEPAFLKALLDQPQVVAAMADRRPDSMTIPPHKVGPA